MTTLLTYCHGTDMPRCTGCQRLGTWSDLHQLPAPLRDGLVKEALMVNRMHCEMTSGGMFVDSVDALIAAEKLE